MSVLGLVGMELIFLVAVGMVLCSRLVTETVLISHQCLSVAEQRLHSVETSSGSCPVAPVSRLGVGKRLGRGHSRDG